MDHGAYEGKKNDLGEPHGTGRMQYASGHTYDGDWKEGCCDGQGKFTFPDGQEYEGQWKAGKRHGRGVLQLPNGDRMEGEWEHGEFLARGERPPANLLPTFASEKEPPKPPIGARLEPHPTRPPPPLTPGVLSGRRDAARHVPPAHRRLRRHVPGGERGQDTS